VNQDCLKLTTYFAERDRHGNRFLADALLDVYGRHGLRTSVMLRGTEGFGSRHRLQTQRLLTLSEDLPLVTAAVDTRARIEEALEDVEPLVTHGLITLERARMLTAPLDATELPAALARTVKLTVYCGRAERLGGEPAHRAVVDILHRHGVAGASVLLGVDGTAHGVRRRATFLRSNARVPLMIISVGSAATITSALRELAALMPRPLATLERVAVRKRDGVIVDRPLPAPETDEAGRRIWAKLMVYTSEQARYDGHPLHVALLRRLLNEGATGATCLRGVWGFHGDHAPHGDRLRSLRRHVPVVTIIVDAPARAERWFAIVDEMTRAGGLVTSELVPALRGGDHTSWRLANID
jgi:PII-like signaling protein